jgi:competence protein ComEA
VLLSPATRHSALPDAVGDVVGAVDDNRGQARALTGQAPTVGGEQHIALDGEPAEERPHVRHQVRREEGSLGDRPYVQRLPGRLVRRWLPTAGGGIRLDPGRRAAVLLAAVVLLGAAVAATAVWRGRPVPQPAPPLPAVAAASASSAAELVVSVAGQVVRPGLVRLPAGARVADALQAAGGPVPGADLAGVNLARRLTDGEHVLLAPGAGQAPAAAQLAGEAPAVNGSKVNLNTASLAELDALPGVGPVTARRILDWRAANGRFGSVDQLREVDGIGETRFAQLRELVTT